MSESKPYAKSLVETITESGHPTPKTKNNNTTARRKPSHDVVAEVLEGDEL